MSHVVSRHLVTTDFLYFRWSGYNLVLQEMNVYLTFYNLFIDYCTRSDLKSFFHRGIMDSFLGYISLVVCSRKIMDVFTFISVSQSDTNSVAGKKKKMKLKEKSEKKMKKVLKIKKEGSDYTSQSLIFSEEESLSPINLDIKEEPLPDIFQQE